MVVCMHINRYIDRYFHSLAGVKDFAMEGCANLFHGKGLNLYNVW